MSKLETILEANQLCTVTHPSQPNHSGHSRGRKVHITLDGKRSLCNMLVDKIHLPEQGMSWSTIDNGLCKVCDTQSNQEDRT